MASKNVLKMSMLAALVAATITLVLPAAGSADALVDNHAPCSVSGVGSGNVYEGSGTAVVTASGLFVLTCHATLASGTPVDRATMSTVGNCEIIETPAGHASSHCGPFSIV
jgi:hypothetical protein